MSAAYASNSDSLSHRPTTRIFGIRAGDFGLFASTLIALSFGFIAFFGATFLAIFALLIYNGTGHHVTLDTSYKIFGLAGGILAFVVAWITLLAVWARRRLAGR